MRYSRRFLAIAAAAMAFGALPASAQTISAARIADIVASPDRSDADRTNDLRRKPQPMLAFIGIRPGITAFDVSAAGGYTTELLARSIGPKGKVFGQSRPPNAVASAPPAQREGNSRPDLPAMAPARTPRPSPEALTDRQAKLTAAKIAAAPIVAVSRPFEDPVPPELVGKIDLVTLMFNYHDLGHMGVDRAAMNKAVFRALKKGGTFVLADHAGRPNTGISEAGTLHRVEEAFLRKEVQAAGFKLAAEGKFLRNPNDPRDKNTPDPAQPKDEFVLKFVKP
ncbi:MAG: hypothetical protein WCI94_04685 [Rhodospirillales bacterium]